MDPPGGRHDNDHRNFRNIRILPTADELRCNIPSILPSASGKNGFIENPVACLLDRNFRLLREDSVSNMKEAFTNYSNGIKWVNARIVGLTVGSRIGGWTTSFKVQFDKKTRSPRLGLESRTDAGLCSRLYTRWDSREARNDNHQGKQRRMVAF